jgi:hypothetical protein
VVSSPLNRKCPNFSKTVEIPTPKPYIFLVLVSSSIWWYVGHDHTEWYGPVPLDIGSAQISWKPLETPKPYIFLFLVPSSIWWYVSHDRTWRSRPPLNRSVLISPKPLKSRLLNHNIYSCFLCQVASDGM